MRSFTSQPSSRMTAPRGRRVRIHFLRFLRFTSRCVTRHWKLIKPARRTRYVRSGRERALLVMRNCDPTAIGAGLPLPVNDDILRPRSKRTSPDSRTPRGKEGDLQGRGHREGEPSRASRVHVHLLAQIRTRERAHMGRFAIDGVPPSHRARQRRIYRVFRDVPDFAAT